MEAPTFDWDQIDQLHAEIGAADLAEVLTLFLAEAEQMVAALTEGGLSAGETETTYHALKGSALTLGLARFAGVCSQAEAAARTGAALPDPAQIADLFARDRAAFVTELAIRFAR